MFQFEPYIGALPIRFGMTPSEVEQLLGPPTRVGRTFLNEPEAQWDTVSVRYSVTESTVVEMSFLPAATLTFDSHDLFQEQDLIGFLLRYDPAPFEWMGFLIFLKIGLAATGYHDADLSQRAITVFTKGRWDAYRDQFSVFQQ